MQDPYVYLVSALISAVVALGIELVAKPRLEARKERILAYHRSRLTFEARLTKIITTSAMWAAYEPMPGAEDLRASMENERSRALQELDGVTQALIDDLGSYGRTYLSWRLPLVGMSAQNLIIQYVAIARGIALSDQSAAYKFRRLRDLSVPVQTGLFGGWHPLRRVRALRELSGMLGTNSSSGQGPAQNSGADGDQTPISGPRI